MKPVSFDGCFGRLHLPTTAQIADTAVIVCPGLMTDAMTAYVSIRVFAESISALGMAALRFDYPGTGDSLDLPADANGDYLAVWQRSIDHAIDWMKRTTGVRRVVLCGFQIGAMLAALVAARRSDVAGLALIDPVIEGRLYARQLIFESRLLYGHNRPKNEDLLLHEFQFSPKVMDEIAALDMRRIALPGGLKTAIVARAESRSITELTNTWRDAGAQVSRPAWTGLEPLFKFNLIEEAPLADFSNTLDWFRQEVPTEILAPHTIAPEPAILHPPGVVETPFTFGPGGRLFGILSRPENRTTDQAAVIGNCGHDPHYGPGRQSTTLARRLAASGVASLRIDFSGLGDSVGPPGKENVRAHVFEHDRTIELQAAIDALEALGYRHFTLQGTCSAAYHAFHGALADPRISTLTLVNLPLFTLPKTDLVAQLEQRKQPFWFYLSKIKNRSSWMHLLRRDRDLGLALRLQFVHAPRRVLLRLRSLAIRMGLLPNRSFAWRSLATLSKRGVRTLFVFSDNNIDTEVFSHEFGRRGEGLQAFKRTDIKIVPGMDHGLMKMHERAAAEELIADFAAGDRR